VHGSVLVYNDVLYCTAGRNMYIDGGIRLIRLHPLTGELIGETVMDDKDPETGQDMHTAYLKKTQGNNMPVAHSDILSCDGRNIWMRSQKITFDGKRTEIALQDVTDQNPEDFHIFCQNGFLDDSYFFRSYWTYGRRVTGGYGGWFRAGRLVPSGRILCFDDARVYGYGRKPQYMLNASVVEYQVFAAEKVVTSDAIQKVAATDRAINARSAYSNASSSDWRVLHFFPPEDLSAAKLLWKLDQPALIARAMTITEDTLFIAGPPDLLDERQAYHNPDDPDVQARLKRQAEALEGRLGGQLWAFNKADGKLAARYALDTIPVFDGMAAAENSLYMTTTSGTVIRFSGTGGAVLNQVGDAPTQIIWPEPEDPNYLLPPEESKEADFTRVARCKVTASKLGYRLRAAGREQVGIAVKKLDKPITSSATFKTRIKAAPAGDGLLSNGFLAFGDKPNDADLIKCGIKLRAESVSIIQGPLLSGDAKTAKIKPPGGKTLEITVAVNLEAGKIVCTADGVTVQADIQTPLKSITHVGYAIDSAVIDVAPVEIITP
jgi:hypothetical protein